MKQKTEAKEMTSQISLKHSRQLAYETAANSSGTDAFAGGAYCRSEHVGSRHRSTRSIRRSGGRVIICEAKDTFGKRPKLSSAADAEASEAEGRPPSGLRIPGRPVLAVSSEAEASVFGSGPEGAAPDASSEAGAGCESSWAQFA